MMKPIGNWDDVKAAKDFEPLPAGAYSCRIQGAKIKEYTGKDGSQFEKLEIALDIDEGDFKDFYKQDFDSQQTEDKRWKGVLRLYLPKDDGSEKDGWTASRLKACINAIEDSNGGYHWDWNESKLKGKKAGCIFRREEWSFNGKTGWKAQPFKLIAYEDFKEGRFRLPKDKPLDNKSTPVKKPENFDEIVEIESDDDLPF